MRTVIDRVVSRVKATQWGVLVLCAVVVGVLGGGGISQAQQQRAAADFVAVAPVRLVDTRSGLGGSKLGPDATLVVPIAGRAGVPVDATAVTVNLTVVNGTAPSYLTAWPTGDVRPEASNLNWRDEWPEPNLATVMIGTGGSISLYNFDGSADVVVDLSGYYVDATTAGPPGPAGPSGSFGLVDAAGSPIPGTILSIQQISDPTTGSLQALLAIALDPTGAGISWDVLTGSANYASAEQVFTSDGCTGDVYWDLSVSGAPVIPAVKFVDVRFASPGDTMYRPGTLLPDAVVESRVNAATGGCDDIAPTTLTVVSGIPAGTAPASRPGPLAFTPTT